MNFKLLFALAVLAVVALLPAARAAECEHASESFCQECCNNLGKDYSIQPAEDRLGAQHTLCRCVDRSM
jgi:hypothetical protein